MNQFISPYMPSKSLLTDERISLLCLVLTFSFLFFLTSDLLAVTTPETSPQPTDPEKNTEVFEYVLGDRPDPFVPFITEKAATASINMDEIIERDVTLTGMQLFEPGQLTLVALLHYEQQDFAMVQDFTGKGYMITHGTKIGRKGVVKKIASNAVTIEETAETRAGKKIVTKVVMLLKKEGEE